jgi:hypothetical protein
MTGEMWKVKPGEPLKIPAATFNTFIDAAQDFLDRQHNAVQRGQPQRHPADLVLVRNESGYDRQRFEILGIAGPIIGRTDNEQEFRQRVTIRGITPTTSHAGRFIILFEPLASGTIGLAWVAGVCLVRVNVPDEDYPYHLAEVTDGSATNLTAVKTGSAAILWREGGTGVQWALVRLGILPAVSIFPVNLTQVGGSQGSNQAPATWTYDVTDTVDGETLAGAADPVATPHRWRRPSVGYIIPATFGYAHWNTNGQLVLGWINEVADQQACPTQG